MTVFLPFLLTAIAIAIAWFFEGPPPPPVQADRVHRQGITVCHPPVFKSDLPCRKSR